MKTNNTSDLLAKKIREIIRDEVRKVVQEEVNKSMGNIIAELISKNKNTIIKESVEEENISENERSYAAPKTGNTSIDSILNGMAKSHKPIPKEEISEEEKLSYAEMLGASFNKIKVNEQVINSVDSPTPTETNNTPSEKIAFLKQMVGSGHNNAPAPKSVTESANLPPALKGLFNKDFRNIVKKSAEINKNGGAMFNPSLSFTGDTGETPQ